jgi:superfamily II DNA or RNA helicase
LNKRMLRKWQIEAIDAYRVADPANFLVTATPGAGKTTFALALATNLLEARQVDRIVVVCPTDHLRGQWAEAANHAGITLDPTLPNSIGPVSDDFHGYVTTYAQVASKPAVHRRRVESKRTLVILDEVHHAGDGLSWGEATVEAFGSARRRLSLTGTPFRTNPDERIPFVNYEIDGDEVISLADYTYGYRNALQDNVVRPVMFAAYTGNARWKNSAGDVVAASLSGTETKDEEQKAWRTVLNPKGKWLPHVIAAADERLTAVRAAGMPDAGAMLLATNQEDARAYAEIVREVTGIKPILVLSEDSKASQKIAAYAKSQDRWIVAVRLISEGTDIPRLAVGVWATTYKTPLFFAQAIGRFVRARRIGETATVFLPAVRPLLALAAEIEKDRNSVFTPLKSGHDLLDPTPANENEPEPGNGFEALDAEAEFAHVLASGKAVIGDPYAGLDDSEAEFVGIPGLLDPASMATLLARRDRDLKSRVSYSSDEALSPAWVQAAALRKEINNLVTRVTHKSGQTHAQVHGAVRKAVPGPPSATATLDKLTARRDWLMSKVGM